MSAGVTDVTVSASSTVGTKQSVTVVVGPGSFAYQLAKVTKWTSDDKVDEMRAGPVRHDRRVSRHPAPSRMAMTSWVREWTSSLR